jgi:hypothetical protein
MQAARRASRARCEMIDRFIASLKTARRQLLPQNICFVAGKSFFDNRFRFNLSEHLR